MQMILISFPIPDGWFLQPKDPSVHSKDVGLYLSDLLTIFNRFSFLTAAPNRCSDSHSKIVAHCESLDDRRDEEPMTRSIGFRLSTVELEDGGWWRGICAAA